MKCKPLPPSSGVWWFLSLGVVFLRILSYHPLFLLFISDCQNLTQYPIHSYADDTTLHFSTLYNRRPTQQELSHSRQDAIGRLTSDLSLVSDWGKANLVLFNASKTQFLQLSTLQITITSFSMKLNFTSPPQ